LVDVRDVVAAINQLISKPELWGERYIISGAFLSFKELFDSVAKNFEVKPPNILLGKFALTLALFIASILRLFNTPFINITKETVRNSLRRVRYNNTKSKEVLGLEYTEISQTLDYCCNSLLPVLKKP
jgi:nucleoside-diphosphate-sugar epimerase